MPNQLNNREVFDNLANDYWLNTILSLGFTAYIRKKVIRKLGIQNGKKVLDIMCGTGNNTELLLKHTEQITGLDFSEKMIDIARKKYAGKAVTFITKDFLATDNLLNKYKHIVCTFGLKQLNVTDYLTFAQQLKHSLESDGSFCLAEVYLYEHNMLNRVTLFYMHQIVPYINLLFTGTKAHRFLYDYVRKDLCLESLQKALAQQGFTFTTEYIAFRSAIMIYGNLKQ